MQVPGIYKLRYVGNATLGSAAVRILFFALHEVVRWLNAPDAGVRRLSGCRVAAALWEESRALTQADWHLPVATHEDGADKQSSKECSSSFAGQCRDRTQQKGCQAAAICERESGQWLLVTVLLAAHLKNALLEANTQAGLPDQVCTLEPGFTALVCFSVPTPAAGQQLASRGFGVTQGVKWKDESLYSCPGEHCSGQNTCCQPEQQCTAEWNCMCEQQGCCRCLQRLCCWHVQHHFAVYCCSSVSCPGTAG